ncbi:LysR family transcriptional regulator [Tranquillimonas alkanivorans]|uniref:Transcriptional regulator, LysR family n=1 Tax=Tranquillimonas alkanivorans TaxID=441119 RepID=A0A1I5M9W8_9RHOB|nr:LysR family transcriptional regulator [Tranquillimonas alkanivorans]SFP05736.1 transcriptional regulator, LysR family [Tranquillimonas alkanivorans]
MPRNLDLTALRSFVAVADTGGVTKASGFLNLTQSAVSMQLKRLEEALGLSLLDRSSRSVSLTSAGEQLLSYARRMLELNDEVMSRMTDTAFEGELVLGVPHDIVYPAIPQILQRFAADFPRVRVQLLSSFTRNLKSMYGRGEIDFILTTEDGCDVGGETLSVRRLVWVGAIGGNAWRDRPLRLAFGTHCIFRTGVQRALDAVQIPWEMAVESQSDRTIEATVAADLAVHAVIEGTEPPYTEPIPHGGALPELKSQSINLYRSELATGEVAEAMAALIRQHYRAV